MDLDAELKEKKDEKNLGLIVNWTKFLHLETATTWKKKQTNHTHEFRRNWSKKKKKINSKLFNPFLLKIRAYIQQIVRMRIADEETNLYSPLFSYNGREKNHQIGNDQIQWRRFRSFGIEQKKIEYLWREQNELDMSATWFRFWTALIWILEPFLWFISNKLHSDN